MRNVLFIALAMMTLSLHAVDRSWDLYKKQTLQFQEQIPGWCSLEKAEKMMQLIYDTHPGTCVEIGVFGGSSVYPTAKALKYLNAGVVHAIDPWSKEECLEGYTSDDLHYQWWASIDLATVLQNFMHMLKSYRLNDHCNVMRMSSREALSYFTDESIDILHIDGNHSEASALADVQMFFPKLKKGGYLWFDDVNWSSTSKAVEYLMYSEQFVMDNQGSTSTCFLFQKI
jgi:cephalosporin hydroxylase